MKKVLCVCNTYYQLIMALQLKITIKHNEKVWLVITDHSKNTEHIIEPLNSEHIFEEAYYVKTREMCLPKKHLKEKIDDVIVSTIGNNSVFTFLQNNGYFDELIYYNSDIGTQVLFANLVKINPNIACSKYEEGVLSYNLTTTLNKKLKIIYALRGLLGKENLHKRTHQFYCCHPSLYQGSLDTIKVPFFTRDEIKQTLKNVFLQEYSDIVYNQKYIFFSSICDCEGGKPVKELELIVKIADLVGRDNLIVKVHPRDDIDRFESKGLLVEKNYSVPWEAFQLNYDFSNYTFLTAFSGSVLNLNLSIPNPPQIIFLFNLCQYENNALAKSLVNAIRKVLIHFREGNSFSSITVAETLNDITTLN